MAEIDKAGRVEVNTGARSLEAKLPRPSFLGRKMLIEQIFLLEHVQGPPISSSMDKAIEVAVVAVAQTSKHR